MVVNAMARTRGGKMARWHEGTRHDDTMADGTSARWVADRSDTEADEVRTNDSKMAGWHDAWARGTCHDGTMERWQRWQTAQCIDGNK